MHGYELPITMVHAKDTRTYLGRVGIPYPLDTYWYLPST